MGRRTTIGTFLPALAVAAAGVVAACGSAPPVPEDQFYRLKAVRAESAAPAKLLFPGTVEIDRFVADGVTAGRPIVYSEAGKPYQVREYHYHFWTQPPTVMLRDELVSYLRVAKIAKAVVTPEMRVNAEYVLTGKIIRLEKVIGTPPKAVLEIELGVRKATGGELIFLNTYRIEAASEGPGVDDAVHALNAALSTVYGRFVADLAKE
ncbi:MAG: membrane integrity-associated transporter subunit PqiC [Rhodospirillales bacterium]|nr:membrane integrity-associated transporter subunit PqiC [Rhodospirillales bacterium]